MAKNPPTLKADAGRTPAAATAELDALFKPFDQSSRPGLMVGVAQHGKVLYRCAFGLADIELGLANQPTTRMRIGSTSKHFTCLAALLLAEDGLLDVDAPASRWFPELPQLDGMPTLRQFMNHTSGHRCYVSLMGEAAGLTIQPPGKALPAQLRQTGTNFPPGEGQLYCNGGYHLLSLAIAKASGMPFEEFLRQRLFEPLGMHDTTSEPSDMKVIPGLASQYLPLPDGSWRRGIFNTEELLGEGAIVSTLDDMLKWLGHLRRPRIGTAKTWRQMTELTRLNNGHISTYGLGLWREQFRGVETIHHAGNVVGGASQMLTVPEHGLDVMILTNGVAARLTDLAKRVIEIVLPDEMTGSVPKMATSRRYSHLLDTQYHGERGLVLRFADAGGRLGLALQGPPMPFLRDEKQVLKLAFEDCAMGPFVFDKSELQADADGQPPKLIHVRESGRIERYRRLPATAPSTRAAGKAWIGRYASVDLDAEATIGLEGESLIMRFRGGWGGRTFSLQPLSASVVMANALNEPMQSRLALTLERAKSGVTGFRLNGGRTRRVWFESKSRA